MAKRKPKLQMGMEIGIIDTEGRPINPSTKPYSGSRVRIVGVQAGGDLYLSEIGGQGFIMTWVDDILPERWIPIIELDNEIVCYGHLVRWERVARY